MFFVLRSSFYQKIGSFEVHLFDIAQKLRKLQGGSKAIIAAFEPPNSDLNFWVTTTKYISKDHIFYVEVRFQHKKLSLFWKRRKKSNYKIPLHLAAEKGHFTK